MIDARIDFEQQAEHVGIKASGVKSTLSRLMPNIGGPKQRRRALLSSVITSVLTYSISIWVDALKLQQSRRRIAPVYRLSALRVAVSEDAVCVIARMLPIEMLAEERRSLYQRRKSETLSAIELSAKERRKNLQQWQEKWDNTSNRRWTHRLIPLCPVCTEVDEDAEHVLFRCHRFREMRRVWESDLGREVLPETMLEAMLSSQVAWDATSNFAAAVIKELRREKRERKATA
ncbi:uncharacterized protein LOC107046023 [Diachasma alloeum]|uniref:uncharacterized protein LOC107046023 n=1 Tax=Diachasma alloeum TaxID=454923 RepID=UPI0007382766|nr:uncharacterized protein LOC107046023 [Diachasma alloeum]